jgi:hypothetical protein
MPSNPASQLPVFLITLLLYSSLGWYFAAKLSHQGRDRLLLAPAIGSGIVAVISAIAYKCDVPTAVFAVAIAALALASVLSSRTSAIAAAKEMLDQRWVTALVVLFLAVCALPAVWGNVQYMVFQGNHWDHINYLTGAAVYTRETSSVVAGAGDAQLLANPLLSIAQSNLHARNAVMLQFAVIGILSRNYLYLSTYAFLLANLASSFMAMHALLRTVYEPRRPRTNALMVLAAAACVLGFWGQYAVEINAWSQVASTPLFIAIGALVLGLAASSSARQDGTGMKPVNSLHSFLVLAFLIASSFYIYPEGAIFFLVALLAALSCLSLWESGMWRVLALTGLAICGALMLCLPAWQESVGFLTTQTQMVSGLVVNWWHYFDSFLFARDIAGKNSVVWQTVSFLAGELGDYFLSPADSSHLTALNRLSLLVLFLIVVGEGMWLLHLGRKGNRGQRLLGALAAAGVAGALLLFAMDRYWAAGKAFSYISPFVCALLVGPAIASATLPKVARLGAYLWVGTQLIFIGLGIGGLTNTDGIRYAYPFPETQDPRLKTQTDWDIRRQLQRDFKCGHIEIFATHPIFAQYAEIAAYEMHLPFRVNRPVTTQYDEGRAIGVMPRDDRRPVCDLIQTGTPLQMDAIYPYSANRLPFAIAAVEQKVDWEGRPRVATDVSIHLPLTGLSDQDRRNLYFNIEMQPVFIDGATFQNIRFEEELPARTELTLTQREWISLRVPTTNSLGETVDSFELQITSIPDGKSTASALGVAGEKVASLALLAFRITSAPVGRIPSDAAIAVRP